MSADFPFRQSSIKTYLECPRKAHFIYVDGRRGKTFPSMGIGTATHKGAEAVLLAKRDGRDWSPDVAAADAVRAAQSLLSEVDFSNAEDERGPFVDRAATLARAYAEQVAPHVECVDVERRIEVELCGVLVTGTVDVIEPTRIRDTKTTRKAPPVWGEPGYRFQLGLYAAMVAEACFDSKPVTAVIDALVLSEKTPRATASTPFPTTKRSVRHLPIVLDEAMLAEERESALATLCHVDDAVSRGDWHRNPAACAAWNRPCEFLAECYPTRARALAETKAAADEQEPAAAQ